MKATQSERRREARTLLIVVLCLVIIGLIWWIFAPDEAKSQELPRDKPVPEVPGQAPVPGAPDQSIPITVTFQCRHVTVYAPPPAQTKAEHLMSGHVGGGAMLLERYADNSFIVWIVMPNGVMCPAVAGTELEALQQIMPPGKDS
jgi:hypothetical protein